MGVTFKCCECMTRVAVMVIAVISTVHFLLESAVVVVVGADHLGGGYWSPTTPYFYAMLGAQIIMVIMSVLLWLGAYYNIFWFCIPWLFMTLLNLLYHAYILLILIIKMFTKFSMIKIEMFFFIIISCAVLIYMDKIVGTFVHELIKNGKNKSNTNRYNDEENRPLISDNN